MALLCSWATRRAGGDYSKPTSMGVGAQSAFCECDLRGSTIGGGKFRMRAAHAILQRRREFLGQMLRGLQLLEADLDARRRGVEFLYVPDFAAIYEYAYQSIKPGDVSPLPSELPERGFARGWMALQF